MSKRIISVVIPVFNEEQNIKPLAEELLSLLPTVATSYTILFVNDGSTDRTKNEINKLCRENAVITGIHLYPHIGKASALRAGFDHAQGDVIITMDGDLQDDPKEIPKLLSKLHDGYDLVVGWKQQRKDSFLKVVSSHVFNFFATKLIHTSLHDINSGLKAYRPIVAKNLIIYGELHRYIPILTSAKGFRVAEIPVNHRKRRFGNSKYGFSRFYFGALDLFTVLFHAQFRTRPLHLFGFIGLPIFMLGFISAFYLISIKLLFNQAIGHRPLLTFSIMLMIIGVQIGITGLLGEQIARTRYQDHPGYLVDSIVRRKKIERLQRPQTKI